MTLADAKLDSLLPRVIELRHEIHRYPELGFEEVQTQERVIRWLREFGYEPRPCAATGVVADVGSGEGSMIALRADLDALPIHETTDLPYRSTHAGVSHKCGHDGHTSILCGVAALLAGQRDRLPGRIRLLFQPAEEGVRGGGARVMIEEGALDGVSEVYGLHNWPGFPSGDLRVIAGPTMAEVHTLDVRLIGRGGHGSQPEACIDPIAAGAQLVTALNSMAARSIGQGGGGVFSVCQFSSGTTYNVIPSEALLRGTLRTFDTRLRDRLVERIEAVARGTASAMGVEIEFELERGYPVLVNDEDCVQRVRRAGALALGSDRVSDAGLPLGASEDFAYFAAACPSAYFFLGAGAPVGATPSCHHPDFDFDDSLCAPGIRTFLAIVEDRFGPLI